MTVDFDPFWSEEAKALRPPGLAGLVAEFQGQADVMTLHVGLPPPCTFPLQTLMATTTAGSHELCDKQKMATAQQYIFSKGYQPLLDWLILLTKTCHKPEVATDIVLTSGAVHALSRLISCLTNRGDFLLLDEYTYAHALECIFIPKGLKLIPVKMDQHGMDPQHLEDQIKSAGRSASGRSPGLVYVIPTGHNPTGCSMTTTRKRDILDVCCRNNLLVLEDDAYWGLQFGSPSGASSGGAREGLETGSTTGMATSSPPGLQLPPSFLSMDQDGRVIRIDTFAKLLGPGYRLGWVTASPKLIERLSISVQADSVGPSSLSQVMISQLLQQLPKNPSTPSQSLASSNPGEGPLDRFEGFLKGLQYMYGTKAALAVAAAQEHLEGLAEWSIPEAGMFMWFKVIGPNANFDTSMIKQLVAHLVVVVPGSLFWADGTAVAKNLPCPYFRLTFGSLTEDEIKEGFKRLEAALRAAASQEL